MGPIIAILVLAVGAAPAAEAARRRLARAHVEQQPRLHLVTDRPPPEAPARRDRGLPATPGPRRHLRPVPEPGVPAAPPRRHAASRRLTHGGRS